MIDKEQVKHIASLARLKLEDKEVEQFSKELSEVLSYVEKLNEIDFSDVSPTLSATSDVNVFRNDEEPDEQSEEMTKKLLDSAPDNEDGYIKVKAIL